MSGEFAGKTVLVTGVSSGIGRAAATAFLAEGATVIGFDRRPIPALTDARFHAIQVDICETGKARAAVRQAAAITGKIDIVVNAAGISHFRRINEIGEDEWDEMFAVNVKGLFFIAMECAEIMAKNGGGRIINLGSNAGRKGRALAAHYAATKAAVKSLSESLALGYAGKNITANTVCPAVTRTGMWDDQFPDLCPIVGKTPEELYQGWANATPLRRVGETTDVVELIKFLAGPRGGFVNGQEINVCGGFMLTC